jgi:lipoic acid synthetase
MPLAATTRIPKPEWLKIRLPQGETSTEVSRVVAQHRLHTICTGGLCPNRGECWERGTATFMLGGDICTRACKFCHVKTGRPAPLDPEEPANIARSVQLLQLKHVVLTSVDRDDLGDLGAAHWAQVIRAVKERNPGTTMEALIPDFQGRKELVNLVVATRPEVISHNIETVRRLSAQVRSRATYETSIAVLRQVAASGLVAKSGMMLGLGETPAEVLQAMDDLLQAGCTVMTIGQYLQPSKSNIAVAEYVAPEVFEGYRRAGKAKGFAHIESAPLVRSSYRAERHVAAPRGPLQVKRYPQPLAYREAWQQQQALLEQLKREKQAGAAAAHHLLLVEHPHVYTLGRNGSAANLLAAASGVQAELIRVDRGGDITYHGPGQLVAYPIFCLDALGIGIKDYVHRLEEVVMRVVARYGLQGQRMDGATGVWIDAGTPAARKICAIGIRCSQSVTMHGFALNVNTDLSYFNLINPCGFADRGVTSIAKETGKEAPLEEVKALVVRHIEEVFGLQAQAGEA